MPRDEYNTVNITNDRQVSGNEFGNFSTNEYKITSENSINRDETNVTNNSELNDISQTSTRDHDDIDKKLSQRDRDLIEDAANGNSGSSAASSGSSSSSNSSTSASSSSSSSSSASSGASSSAASSGGAAVTGGVSAAAASSAVASAAVVVTAFAVVTAAPIILSNAHILEKTLVIEPSAHEVYYYLDLLEPFEDESYIVTVTNEKYDEYQTITEGKNEGVFDNLTVNQEYTFMVIEGTETEISRLLYKDTFRTFEEVEPEPEPPEPELITEFKGYTFDKTANFLYNTTTITLDYIDEKEILTDFAITFTCVDSSVSFSNTYALEKTTETQTIQLENAEEDMAFDLFLPYTYKLSYKEDGEEKTIEGGEEFYFTDNSGAQSSFNGLVVSPNVNYKNKEITVTLDYVDDFNYFSHFNLVVTPSNTNGVQPSGLIKREGETGGDVTTESYTFPLDKTTEPQVVSFPQMDLMTRYVFSVTYFDALKNETIGTEPNEPMAINDISNAESKIIGATLSNSANFLTDTVLVTLDYIDDFGYFSNFKLTLTDAGELIDYTFPLDKTTTQQSATCSSADAQINWHKGSFYYSITCETSAPGAEEDEVLASGGPISFADNSGSNSIVNGATLSHAADFVNKKINVTLDYLDGYDVFYDFMVVLTDMEEGYFVYPLEKKTTPQEVSLDPTLSNDNGLTFDRMPFDYSITYKDARDEEQYEHVIDSGSEFYFTENTYVGQSSFNGINFISADYQQHTINVSLDYADPDENNPEITSFVLYITDNDISTLEGGNNTIEWTLRNDTSVQTVHLSDQTLTSEIDLEHHDITYRLEYIQNECTEEVTGEVHLADINGRTSGISQCLFGYDENHNPLANGDEGSFAFSFEYHDYFGTLMWSDFMLTFTRDQTDAGDSPTGDPQVLTQYYSININSTMAPNYNFYYGNTSSDYSYSGDYIDLLDGEPVHYEVSYYDPADPNEERVIYQSGDVTFADSTIPHVYDVNLGLLVPRGDNEWYIPLQLSYADISNKYYQSLRARFEVGTGEDMQSVSLLFTQTDGNVGMTPNWQCGWLPIDDPDDVSTFIDNPNVYIVFYWSHEDPVEGYVTEEQYREQVTLSEADDDTPLEILGMVMEEYAMPTGYDDEIGDIYALTINYFFYNGSIDTEVNKPMLVFKQNGEIVFQLELDEVPGPCDDVSVSMGSYSSYVNDTYGVYISYYDNDLVYHEVLCYQNLFIYPQV